MSRATELADWIVRRIGPFAGEDRDKAHEAAALLRTQDEALTKIQADMEAMKALLDKWGKE